MQTVPRAPAQLRLEIYGNCPLRCRHCYQAQTFGSDEEPSPLLADAQRFHSLIDDFVAMGGRSVSLSGGEMLIPARWPRVRRILSNLARQGVREIRINTALAHVGRNVFSELVALPIEKLYIQTGLDGPSVHDWLRFDGALDRTLDACGQLRSLGVERLTARTTLFFGHHVGGRTLDNLGDLEWILQAAEAQGIRRLKTKVVHPSGNLADEIASAAAIWQKRSDSLLSPALERLIRIRMERKSSVRLLFTNPLPQSFLPIALDAHGTDPEGVAVERCRCGADHLAVDGAGRVYRCLYNFGKPQLSIGSVLQESLSTIAARHSRLSYVERSQPGTCSAFDDNLRR